jgi:hypothetical protein
MSDPHDDAEENIIQLKHPDLIQTFCLSGSLGGIIFFILLESTSTRSWILLSILSQVRAGVANLVSVCSVRESYIGITHDMTEFNAFKIRLHTTGVLRPVYASSFRSFSDVPNLKS